ncbi:hypothetical protein K470DRAFT_259289 [Piedraia hortae CBS 480.64]|uniref:MARVEL domain-containing protein n=1 Tax=Piedraia hortae CBS 480.64 TaxID=1314780 RepID=A0A6A7BW98_9PEZI|nr:hypothetical protein K470DRAFT_259289 [Piedraia hortae CBS 480.64]
MVAVPAYGAAPLAKTFVVTRGLSLIAIICIVGLTANFVSQIVGSNVDPPHEIVGTLVITCMAGLYCFISVPYFYSNANVGLLVMTGLDLCLWLSFVVISLVLGKPISFLQCQTLPNISAAANAQLSSAYTLSLASNLGKSGSTLGLQNWAGSTRVNCYETKALWGLCIALAILYTCSSIILPTLWYKARRAAGGPKSVV